MQSGMRSLQYECQSPLVYTHRVAFKKVKEHSACMSLGPRDLARISVEQTFAWLHRQYLYH